MSHIVLPHRSAWKQPPKPPFEANAEVCDRYGLVFGAGVLSGWMEIYWPSRALEIPQAGSEDVEASRVAGAYGWGLGLDTASDYTLTYTGTDLIPDMSSATDPVVKTLFVRAQWLGQWSAWDAYSGPIFLFVASNNVHGAFAKIGSAAPVLTHNDGGAGGSPPGGGATWVEQSTDMEQATIMASRVNTGSTNWSMRFWSDWLSRGPAYIGENTHVGNPKANASQWNVGINRNRHGGNNASQEFTDLWLGSRFLTGDEGLALLEQDKWAMYEEYGRRQFFLPSAGAPPAGTVARQFYHHRHHNRAA